MLDEAWWNDGACWWDSSIDTKCCDVNLERVVRMMRELIRFVICLSCRKFKSIMNPKNSKMSLTLHSPFFNLCFSNLIANWLSRKLIQHSASLEPLQPSPLICCQTTARKTIKAYECCQKHVGVMNKWASKNFIRVDRGCCWNLMGCEALKWRY